MNDSTKYVNRHAKLVKTHLKHFAEYGDDEAMHQLRVNMKKLKAVLRMVLEVKANHKFGKHKKKKFKKLFKDGGQIRQLQLISSWLKKNKYTELLQQSASLKQLPQFILLFNAQFKKNEHLLTSFAKRLSQLEGKVKEKELLAYSISLKQTISKLRANAAMNEWHDLRKKIKQLLYMSNLLNNSSRLNVLTVIQFKGFDLLQDTIGAWHDLAELKQWLINEGFLMSKNRKVKFASSKAWQKVNQQLLSAEKKVESSLRKITSGKIALKK